MAQIPRGRSLDKAPVSEEDVLASAISTSTDDSHFVKAQKQQEKDLISNSTISLCAIDMPDEEGPEEPPPQVSLNDLFDLLDKDGDGELSLKEVVGGCAKLDMTKSEAKKLFKELDVDRGGTLSRPEFDALRHPGDAVSFAVFEGVELDLEGVETTLGSSALAAAEITGPLSTLNFMKQLFPLTTEPLTLNLSPRAEVTVPLEYREGAGIPMEAYTFAFIYPTEHRHLIKALGNITNLAKESWAFTFLVGGFAYYDDKGRLLSINAIGFADTSASLLLVGPYRCRSDIGALELKGQGRLQNITIRDIQSMGYYSCGWVHPSERLCGEDMGADNESYDHGAFMYIRDRGAAVGTEGAEKNAAFLSHPLLPKPLPDLALDVDVSATKTTFPFANAATASMSSVSSAPIRPRGRPMPHETPFTREGGRPTPDLEPVFYKLMTKDEYARLKAKPPHDAAKAGPLLSHGTKKLESASNEAVHVLDQASKAFTLADGDALKGEEEMTAEEVRESRMRKLSQSTVVLFACVFGVLFYMHEETRPCKEDPSESCKWTLQETIYFLVVTISTCGYGDYAPSTALSRGVTAVFIFGGVYFMFSFFGEIMMSLIAALERRFYVLVAPLRARIGTPQTKGLVAGHQAGDMPPAWEHYAAAVGFNLVFGLVAFIFLSAWAFRVLDPSLTLADSLWYCWTTATTVGYDSPLTNDHARTFATFHILAAVSWLV